jgi:hypothetical protein
MTKRLEMVGRVACGVVAATGASFCSATAFAQSTPSQPDAPWAAPSILDSGKGMKGAGSAASAAAQKGAAGASRATGEAARMTSYGVSHPGEVVDKSAKASREAFEETRSGLMEAAESPLRDFNMVQKAIPAVLTEAEKAPYDARGLDSCKAITDQVVALDLALGPDVDTPNIEKIRDPYARSAQFVADSALDAVKDVTTHIIPARNVIRRITGANRYERNVRTAVLAGAVRRGFLKAYGMMHACDWPAAPMGFQPVRAAEPGGTEGVHATQAQTIATGPMVVTVSTVTTDAPAETPAAAAPARGAGLGFAPSSGSTPAAGAWRIGRTLPGGR